MPRPNKGYQLSDEPNDAGVYEIKWTEKGRSKRRTTGTSDYGEAQLFHARFVLAMQGLVASDAAAPASAEDGGLTVREVLDYYHQQHVAALDFDASRDQIGRCCKLVSAFMGDVLITELCDEHVRNYARARARGEVFYLDDNGRRVGKVGSSGTARYDLSYLVAAMNYAVQNKKLKRGDVPELTLPEQGDPRDRYLSVEEAGRLFAATAPKPGERMSRIFRLLSLGLATAARQEAILELTWDRVNFDTGLIDFNKPGRKKTKKRRAVVPMSDDLRAVLRRAYVERVSDFVMDHEGRVSQLFGRWLDRCKIVVPDGSGGTHIMRHTWATWQAQAGQSMTYIAGVLGDTVATTEKHYARHSPKTLAGVVNTTPLPGAVGAISLGVTPGSGVKVVQLCSTVSADVQEEKPRRAAVS